MKTAIVHDRLTEFGGAVRVALVLAKVLKADIYTGKYNPNETYPNFNDFKIKEVNPIRDFPISQWHALVETLDAAKFSSLSELKNYDLLFTSGEWAHFASRQNQNNIWYCHTPNRVLYDLRQEIRSRLIPPWRPVFDLWVKFWTSRDQESVKRVRRILANSQNVRERVRKFYNMDAEVLYPPIDVKKFRSKSAENYWLSVQRIEPEKRIEIQLKVFERIPKEKLVIVGEGKHGKEYMGKISRWIERLPNVEWRREVSDKELRDLYARCKAVIQTPLDEDFGLISVEAMASGKPCIAVDEGGFKESIIHGETGLLVKEPYVRNFINAIENFEKYDFDSKVCLKRARDFSEKEFVRKIRKLSAEMLSRQVA